MKTEINTYKAKLPELSLKYKTGEMHKVKIRSSIDCANLLRTMFDADTLEYNEEFIALYLNRANNTIGWQKISSGGMSSTVVDPRMIFSTALLCGASAVILAHNHPSGNKQPSESDIRLTNKLKEGGSVLDIAILDHLIITSDNYLSMGGEGLM